MTMLPNTNGRETEHERYDRCVRSYNIAVSRYNSAVDAYEAADRELRDADRWLAEARDDLGRAAAVIGAPGVTMTCQLDVRVPLDSGQLLVIRRVPLVATATHDHGNPRPDRRRHSLNARDALNAARSPGTLRTFGERQGRRERTAYTRDAPDVGPTPGCQVTPDEPREPATI